MPGKFRTAVRREPVLCVAALLALASMLLVPPNAGYLDYLNLHTLGLLWALMLVMAGLQRMGLFDRLGRALLCRVHSTRQLALVLVLLPFFSAMLVTNDVALLTFVPFALEVLALCGQSSLLVPVLVLQTLAANLGSMLTPIGNPQNLYLYAASDMSLIAFFRLMLPYSLLSLGLVLACCLLLRHHPLDNPSAEQTQAPLPRGRAALYAVLFLLCLLAVADVLPWQAALAIVLLALFLADRKTLPQANYALLLTFVCFFVLIGNLGQIPAGRELIAGLIVGREISMGILCSQFMSNVPTAILLSGFSDAWGALLIGVNLGGLGTLIASMASLITWQLLSAAQPNLRRRFFLWFTAANLAFLAVLWALALLIA